jgi:hypothetical protein
MAAKKTAPFDVSNSTKQATSYCFDTSCNYKYSECSCALACPVPTMSGSTGPGLTFLVLFVSRQKVQSKILSKISPVRKCILQMTSAKFS